MDEALSVNLYMVHDDGSTEDEATLLKLVLLNRCSKQLYVPACVLKK